MLPIPARKGAGMRFVTIKGDPRYYVEVGDQGHVTWKGRAIGRVYKGTRTYSPPTHRGSRVAKYHKQAPCWWAGKSMGPHVQFDTRQEGIRYLIEQEQREQA